MINYSIAIMGTTPGTKKNQIQETKAYGTAQVHEVLDLDKFASHMAAHNSPFSKGVIKGVIADAVSCIREQLLEGNKVVLGELGAFYPELQTEGAVTCDDFTAQNIKAVNVRYCPGDDFKDLRSEATFQLVDSRKAQAAAIKVIKNQDTIQGME